MNTKQIQEKYLKNIKDSQEFCKILSQNDQMMQQAFNGFVAQVMPTLLPQMLDCFKGAVKLNTQNAPGSKDQFHPLGLPQVPFNPIIQQAQMIYPGFQVTNFPATTLKSITPVQKDILKLPENTISIQQNLLKTQQAKQNNIAQKRTTPKKHIVSLNEEKKSKVVATTEASTTKSSQSVQKSKTVTPVKKPNAVPVKAENEQTQKSQASEKIKTESKSKIDKKLNKKFSKLGIYMIFTKMRYHEMKEKYPDLSFKEVNQKMSEEYKALSEEERAKWMKLTEEANVEREKIYNEQKAQQESQDPETVQVEQQSKVVKKAVNIKANTSSIQVKNISSIQVKHISQSTGVKVTPKKQQTLTKSPQKSPVKDIKDKRAMTPYMFYLQIRRVELRNEMDAQEDSKAPDSEKKKYDPKEILRIVSIEWKDLEENKRKHFNIPLEIQNKLRSTGNLNDLDSLREAVLQNVQENNRKAHKEQSEQCSNE